MNLADSPRLTCTKCGWVHFGLTAAQCQDAVSRFNTYYETLSEADKLFFYGGKPASLESYRRCRHCGAPHTDMRPAEDGDAPDGVTIQPIMIAERSAAP